MLEFIKHTDFGNPVFLTDELEDWYYIKCGPYDQGRWLVVCSETLVPGTNVHIQAEHKGVGEVSITWWIGMPERELIQGFRYLTLTPKDGVIDELVTIPEGAHKLRLELRVWEKGEGEFMNVSIEFPVIEVELVI